MEFKLFDRLKDDGDQGDSNSGSGGFGDFGGSSNNQQGSSFGGNGVERRVEDMFNQGYSEEEIKEELQGQFSQTEIERAINSAVKSSATGNNGNQGGPEPMTPYQDNNGEEAVSPMDEGFDGNSEGDQQMNQNNGQQQQQDFQQNQGFNQNQNNNNQNQQVQQPQQGGGQQMANPSQGTVDPEVEELIETIVSENFQRVEQRFDDVFDEIDILADKVDELEDRVEELEVRDDEDQQQFVQKVDEMEDHIDSYESRIGGLEKAFQQVLPSLVDNVRDLTSLVQEIKQEKGIETDTNVSQQEMDDMDIEDW
ncbi:hypothetical protein GKQ38_05175 [Candidatus Nanohaloarchaea archaeon]|nr:hypothetical protein GKQ38_05175 [Candidatus Nanohaloarchaea archaeon]